MRTLVYGDRVGATGGSRTYLMRLLEAHRANGIDTTLLVTATAVDDSSRRWCDEAGVDLELARPRPRGFRKGWLALAWDLVCLRAIVRKIRPDVLIVSNQDPGGGFAAFLLRTPLLFVMHTYPRKPPKLRWVPARFSSRARRVLTVSHFAKRQIEDLMGVPGRFVEVIHNAFDPRTAAVTRAPDADLVLTVGHVVGYKNPDLWLDVAEEVVRRRPRTRFAWLGDGDLERMRMLVRRRGLDASVSFLGHVTRVDHYYARASVYFQPSRIENMAMAVVDAMACGLPCVVSDVGGLPESVAEGESGFLCAVDDRKAFVDRILRCLEDPQLRNELGSCGKLRAERLFSPVIQGRRYLRLLADVSGTGGEAEREPLRPHGTGPD